MSRISAGKMQSNTLNFVFGLTIGLVFAYVGISYMTGPPTPWPTQMRYVATEDQETKLRSPLRSFLTHEDLEKIRAIVQPIEFMDAHVHNDDDKEARRLEKEIRVLCWVMTSPENLESKAKHVRSTWARRCNKLLFISSVTNKTFPAIGIDVPEGRDHLTAKTMKAFKYIYEHHMDDADWFMKADDDTYVILENLRYFLSSQNTNEPIYFGHHFKTIVKQGYFSGGAGYVLSKESMRRFGAHGSNETVCRQDGGAEDAEFGKCMENLGVKVGNSTDKLGRSRFHCFDPDTHLMGGYPDWYYQYDAHGAKKGRESISDYAISFHYVPVDKMYAMEFYIYHLRPYGIESGKQELNQGRSS
ncbi:glycoprotein-N-acetylgalactosamine 3-beta-galactosyltransferase 1-like isoform X2 [Dreissena polymorpha]|uniref:glycoprotein-N-acetylgalactosamine 3-beta-galactosyltransferase 1-like isoform X2 n=1 Tax=Dreissena polymorpha TaxID=45954 RepID=UPI002265428E|nr:glycoprotein-N-acetylgalactosamine 3-beta-galactosyltransferase 1-like isoform X2 [Dreissena polymorpha]